MTATGIRPVAGENFRRVAALDVCGSKRRKVLALVAAFADGGQAATTTRELATRLSLPDVKVIALATRLRDDGYLVRTRKKLWRLSNDVGAAER